MPNRKQVKRLDLGFSGGQVLALRTTSAAFELLVKALDDPKGARWHELNAEDSSVRIDLSQVVYVRRETEEQRVGF